ncbi:efflux RND transporter periplasmic adaptor subunit [Catalinimonas niigatensis]|uniref:efflux RND transporter periplasmic adaptor subunit n=1 Tax=Catalinimonas niigatensis TaxID=1397264 RepID=UPI002665C168|nr:efflux RND transporter periplasmic adaptor subunit [Catalinimonas niigatensis]WPP51858.1 efflux RND transporter periplasmic adaptor subunit [Catalinimonas niigatensis]
MYKPVWFLVAVALLGYGCQTSPEEEHTHGEGGHEHGAEALSYTVWTDSLELFVEFPPLIVGQLSSFAAHFTRLEDYKPVTEGSVTVSLLQEDKGIRQKVDAPSSPGIFNPALQPKQAGQAQLIFELNAPGMQERIIIDSLQVYASTEEAVENAPEQEEGEVTFLKEQAWKVKFQVQEAQKRDIHEVIKTSGQIMPVPGEERVINARTSGNVTFAGSQIVVGKPVQNGERLFNIQSAGFTENNLGTRLQQARAEFERAQADYERAQALVEDQIISRKNFQQIKASFEVAQANYNNLTQNYGSQGQQIQSPIRGFIKNILVEEGAYVNSGAPLATISQDQRLMIKGEVSQKYFQKLPQIRSANFKTTYQDQVHDLDSFNGKLLSYGKSAGGEAHYLPVYFELDNQGNLLSGSFLELYLKTQTLENVLVIPKSALMEDYGTYYVYEQISGESFSKREVLLGADDGLQVQVLEGLAPGAMIVTQGAYQVKMASMSSSVPAHGHSH